MVLFDSKDSIKGLDCSDMNMLIWTNKQIEIYEIVETLSKKLFSILKYIYRYNIYIQFKLIF